ncbi:ABC-three component system middle component 7 [Faecalibacillus intestinalis]|uniref:ABC-three component system middle component 7 n=1 Tax=Faecalibacillus intestinalis TaxID=1982626 RepID=UPI00295ED8F3|nr:ABC-three component system middle component 7 [Faecalibacillus intestinalis]
MQLPNKIVSFKESVLYKFPIILCELDKNKISINELYMKTMKSFKSIDEFIDVLDCLFALNKIQYDEESGRLINVI